MKKIPVIFSLVFVLIVMPLILFGPSACANGDEEEQEIIRAFESFESNDNYIFQTSFEFHLGSTVIDNSKLIYNGRLCEFLTSTDTCAYGYCVEADRITVHITRLDYETLDISLVDTVVLPNFLTIASFFENSFYFRTTVSSESGKGIVTQIYTVYNLSDGEITTTDTDDIDLIEQRENPVIGDYEFDLLSDFAFFRNINFDIRNIKTDEVKSFTLDDLKSCEEGAVIATLPDRRWSLGNKPRKAFARGDDIYLVLRFSVDSLSTYLFVLKYDFKTENVEYCSTVHFDIDPEALRFFYVPSKD